MPSSYTCDICNQVAGDFMVTSTATGASQIIGIECLLEWAMALTESWQAAVNAEQGRIDAATGPADTPADGWEYDQPEPPPKRRQRASEPTPQPVASTGEGGPTPDGTE